jgi:hypothetical protein
VSLFRRLYVFWHLLQAFLPVGDFLKRPRGLREHTQELLIEVFGPEDVIPIEVGDLSQGNDIVQEVLT